MEAFFEWLACVSFIGMVATTVFAVGYLLMLSLENTYKEHRAERITRQRASQLCRLQLVANKQPTSKPTLKEEDVR